MTPAGAGDAPAADLPLLGDVAPQLVDVLVVDLRDLLLAEVAIPALDRPCGAARTLPLLCSLTGHALLLEGNVVVGRGREVGALLRPRARGHELVAAAAEVAATVAAAAQELDALG